MKKVRVLRQPVTSDSLTAGSFKLFNFAQKKSEIYLPGFLERVCERGEKKKEERVR